MIHLKNLYVKLLNLQVQTDSSFKTSISAFLIQKHKDLKCIFNLEKIYK